MQTQWQVECFKGKGLEVFSLVHNSMYKLFEYRTLKRLHKQAIYLRSQLGDYVFWETRKSQGPLLPKIFIISVENIGYLLKGESFSDTSNQQLYIFLSDRREINFSSSTFAMYQKKITHVLLFYFLD